MRIKIVFWALIFVCSFALLGAGNPSVLVHNSKQEIEACKGKLILELVRVWGGDDEEDVNKFFKAPSDIHVGMDDRVYILGRYLNLFRIFTRDGAFIKSIGRKGRGPGDLYYPSSITMAPNGDLAIYEVATHRLQVFSPEGKSKRIIKKKEYISWLGINSKNQFIVHQLFKTLKTKKLLYVWNEKGKRLGSIGTFHDKTDDYNQAERYRFAIDKNDNYYVSNCFAPVIRKYSPDGRMQMAVVYEPQFEIQVKISLNEKGDEIKREEPPIKTKTIVTRSGGSVSISKGKSRPAAGIRFAVDLLGRMFLVTRTRILTLEEMKRLPRIPSSKDFCWIENPHNTDPEEFLKGYMQLLVFGPDGKILAKGPFVHTYSEGIYIDKDRIFVIDGMLNKRILEYRYRIVELRRTE